MISPSDNHEARRRRTFPNYIQVVSSRIILYIVVLARTARGSRTPSLAVCSHRWTFCSCGIDFPRFSVEFPSIGLPFSVEFDNGPNFFFPVNFSAREGLCKDKEQRSCPEMGVVSLIVSR